MTKNEETKPPVIKLAGMHRESIREPNPATGHTPGPWKTFHATHGTWILSESKTLAGKWADHIVCVPDHMEQGGVSCGPIAGQDKSQAEAEANARLIASAPEMLAALKELVDIGGVDQHGFAKTWTLRDNEALSYRLRAAIAKAEGGAS